MHSLSLKSSAPRPPAVSGHETLFQLERTVVDLVRDHVLDTPEAPAVEGDRTLSYGELDAASDRVAAELQCLGLKSEEPVPVLLPPSCNYIVAILGILKAGGCYVPIEKDTPPKRVEYMLADCQSRFLLTDACDRRRMETWAGTALDVDKILAKGSKVEREHRALDSRRRMYIAYTSGSTGQPKGVEIEQRSVVNLVFNYIHELNLTSRDRASLLAYLSFDVSVSDIWPALCSGGTVVIPPPGVRSNPDLLIGWLATKAVSISFIPTGMAEVLFSRRWPERLALRYLVAGGDRLRARPPEGLPFTVINGYGPTESTVFATWSRVAPKGRAQGAPPIGRPMVNMRAYVLDENARPVPAGSSGELYLSGVQVGRGYYGRPELTDTAFMPDPFSTEPGQRMYRTGDWARWLEDGELEFLGRADSQIQIRGFRVELGELEAALYKHPAVRQACCVPVLDDGMPMGTVAHIVPATPDVELGPKLRSHLSELLPEFMVPLKFVVHERLPLTPQGKLDRAALMKFDAAPDFVEVVAEPDDLEAKCRAIWRELLPDSRVAGTGATLWELGGDSLLAMKLLLRIEEATGHQFEYSEFLRNPTLAGILEILRHSALGSPRNPVVAFRSEGRRPPLFCLYNSLGNVEIYRHLVAALGMNQPVYGIRSPALDEPEKLPSSIEEAAAEVIRYIRRIQPQGPPALVGFSWAGWLGFEVARQYYEQEKQRCFCALIGTSAPRRKCTAGARVRHFIGALPSWIKDVARAGGARSRLARLRRSSGIFKADFKASTERVAPALERHLMALSDKYRPAPACPIPVHLFREKADYSPRPFPLDPWQTDYLPDAGWSQWTQSPVDVRWVNGNHASVLGVPHVTELAEEVRRAFDGYLERESISGQSRGAVTGTATAK